MSKVKSQKSKATHIDIEKVAKLANLELSSDEKAVFAKQLDEVLGYVSQLDEVDTEKVEPIGQITGLVNVTRGDVAGPSLSQDEALKNAPKTHNGFFEVKAILDEQ
jgi:aspartyl-tRNA(Asn)/glutamyl-tRNA(Gln) amidotransferase subunit C